MISALAQLNIVVTFDFRLQCVCIIQRLQANAALTIAHQVRQTRLLMAAKVAVPQQ